MSKYGVTPMGVLIKRLDTIIDELHDDLSEGWNVNTRLNPKSFLNVQLTAYADKLTELWEFGEQIYHSMYPYSAEHGSLDNAVQFGGISREEARPTFYPIHSEVVDGTTIPRGSLIRTSTSPTIQFLTTSDATVTRLAFNRANIRVAVIQAATIYTVALNGTLYSFTSGPAPSEADIIAGLQAVIVDDAFTALANDNILVLSAVDTQSTNQLILSGNLTTASVTGIVNFASEMNGEIVLPDGVITEIVTAVPGLISVVNILPRIAGRLIQTDVELRQSYADKIFARSNRMIESVKSAILNNVQGVTSVAGYQNDTNVVDDYGRWPHCIEMVVEGGADMEIALQIWDKKTCGIQTFGDTEVVIPGDEGEPVTMRFNRPEHVFVWFQVTVTLSGTEPLPPNYVEAITDIILQAMDRIEPGRSIVPQRLIEGRIFATVPGIGFLDTRTFYTTDPNLAPGVYSPGTVPITPRQRAVTDETRIEVILGA